MSYELRVMATVEAELGGRAALGKQTVVGESPGSDTSQLVAHSSSFPLWNSISSRTEASWKRMEAESVGLVLDELPSMRLLMESSGCSHADEGLPQEVCQSPKCLWMLVSWASFRSRPRPGGPRF